MTFAVPPTFGCEPAGFDPQRKPSIAGPGQSSPGATISRRRSAGANNRARPSVETGEPICTAATWKLRGVVAGRDRLAE